MGSGAFRPQRVRAGRAEPSLPAGGALCALIGLAGWALWTALLHQEPGQDFLVFHTAARAWLEGDASLIYDGTRLTQAINTHYAGWLQAPLNFHPFLYPPPYLLLLLPFAALPTAPAYIAFVNIPFLALTGLLAWRTARPALSLAAIAPFPQTAFLFLTGQNGFFTATILVAGLSLLRTRPWFAGALLGLLCVKPQFFLLIPLALVAGRHWRALAALLAASLALALASLAILGPGLWHAWLHLALAPGSTYAQWLTAGRLKGQSVFACLMLAGAPPPLANALQLAAALAAAAIVAWAYARPRPAALQDSMLLAAILLAAPHVSSQDAILLACAALLFVTTPETKPLSTLESATLVALWGIELLDPPFLFRGGIATPLVLVLFLAIAARRARSRTPHLTPEPLPLL